MTCDGQADIITLPFPSLLPVLSSQQPLPTMASLFGFGSTPVEVDIHLAGEETRRQVELKHAPANGGGAVEKATAGEGKKESCPVYYDAESVQGSVVVRVKDGKKLVHEGIRLELVGAIGEWASKSDESSDERSEEGAECEVKAE